MNINRGDIYLANLDPTLGGEIRKTRPVLVVSNNINNAYSSTITILPVTSNTQRVYPFEVLVEKGVANLPKKSKVKADQIRTIDKSRFIKIIGNLPDSKMKLVDQAIKIHLKIN